MNEYPSAAGLDDSLMCAYFGGPQDGWKNGDLPAVMSGRKLTGDISRIPLGQPSQSSLFAEYKCTSETQVDGYWRFDYQGMVGPNGEELAATIAPSVSVLADTKVNARADE